MFREKRLVQFGECKPVLGKEEKTKVIPLILVTVSYKLNIS